MKNEKVGVYIGRFQTPHNGHLENFKQALADFDRVIILVGSANIARDPKNPFTFKERSGVLQCIMEELASVEWGKGHGVKFNILPLHDYIYNNGKWMSEVMEQVRSVTSSKDLSIIGCRKAGDSSTEYLDYFPAPTWKKHFYEEQLDSNRKSYNSTSIREAYYKFGTIEESLPEHTKRFLNKFLLCDNITYQDLCAENMFIEDYKAEMYETLPYKNIPFLTGDSIVVCCGHVLLVKRRSYPGKGLLAMPGGFFDAWKDGDQLDTAIRELQEETKIDAPEKVLRGNVRSVTEFGDMNRSLRWRIITKAAYIQLPDKTLPRVKGSDDAEHAFWMPLGELEANRDKFFEDHYSILSQVLGL